MSKVTLAAIAVCAAGGVALARTYIGSHGTVTMAATTTQARSGDCTTTEDAHRPVVGPCDTGNRLSIGPRSETVVDGEADPFAVRLPGDAWQSSLDDGDEIEQILVAFQPNGSYLQVIRLPQLNRVVRVWGSYDLSPTSATEATLTVRPIAWQPQQMCGPNRCRTLSFAGQTVQLRAVDENTVQTNDGLSRRVPIAVMRQARIPEPQD
jgi:hypothetical protein